ncbi:unnamed protein product [Dimorphilus gyrociliatus]|uniref:L-serine deaminase n=1 Tax=Dimorphilus gyrociliatus TaxID=2664684 RepID=A0A7I8VUS9_9ANNE|nr:unnamed protein product [Dimorphilus gyrociliatus]
MLELDEIKRCYQRTITEGFVRRTPLFKHIQQLVPGLSNTVHCKMESLQYEGSYKLRGVSNQMMDCDPNLTYTSMSAGNYGRAFARMLELKKGKGILFMPETAPKERMEYIRSKGVPVETRKTSELEGAVQDLVHTSNAVYLPSYDDRRLLAGYGGIALEIMEDYPEVDVVIVPCGGGGALAGVAATFQLIKPSVRVFGVEPVNASTMYESLRKGEPQTLNRNNPPTIAAGLMPPNAGLIPFQIISKAVEEIVLVNEDEIRKAVLDLFKSGLKVEASGSVGIAALQSNKIPNLTKDSNVVVVCSGSNVTIRELSKYENDANISL